MVHCVTRPRYYRFFFSRRAAEEKRRRLLLMSTYRSVKFELSCWLQQSVGRSVGWLVGWLVGSLAALIEKQGVADSV